MHLNARKLAFLGLLLALTVLLVILSSVLEFNTLFLLAGASFGIGIAIRESGVRIGFGFYLASVLLSLILAPSKAYCITFAAMGFYLVTSEYAYDKMINIKKISNRRRLLWVVKYVAFNAVYLPILFLLPDLVYQGEMDKRLLIALLLAGQIALFVYDRAYIYFQKNIWGKCRKYLKLS